MAAALGKLGMSPDVFWRMSWPELFAAFKGFSDFHSPPEKKDKNPLSRDELNDLMKEYPDK